MYTGEAACTDNVPFGKTGIRRRLKATHFIVIDVIDKKQETQVHRSLSQSVHAQDPVSNETELRNFSPRFCLE